MTSNDEIRDHVRSRYGEIATAQRSCCDPEPCAPGYDEQALASLPPDAVMGLGCGAPVAAAGIRAGETVLDLGSGGGIDVLLAAEQVGPSGRVIGVDMTPEMIERARRNAEAAGARNVEFRQGVIEELPVEAGSVDVVLSNCVINLAGDKRAVFREAHRVLRVGGRLVVADIVARGEIPAGVREDLDRWASCIGGAVPEAEYLAMIEEAGFSPVSVVAKEGRDDAMLLSVTVRAEKA